jgi:ssDNA-binding replication factor A large subunit
VVKVKLKDVKRGMKDIEVTAVVTKKWEDQRSRYTRHALAMLSDKTGEVRLNLWRSQIDQVDVGDTVRLKAAFARIHKGLALELSTWEEELTVAKPRKRAIPTQGRLPASST